MGITHPTKFWGGQVDGQVQRPQAAAEGGCEKPSISIGPVIARKGVASAIVWTPWPWMAKSTVFGCGPCEEDYSPMPMAKPAPASWDASHSFTLPSRPPETSVPPSEV